MVARFSGAGPRLNPTVAPVGPVQVDWTHPLANGLSYFKQFGVDTNPLVCLRGASPGVYQASGRSGLGPRGQGLTGVAHGWWESASCTYAPNAAKGTTAILTTTDWTSVSVPASDAILFQFNNGTGFVGIDISQGSPSVTAGWNVSGTDYRITNNAGAMFAAGQTLSIGLTWNTAAPLQALYSSGKLYNSSATAFSTLSLGTNDFSVGAASSFPSLQFWNSTTAGCIYYLACWDTDLPPSLMAWLNAEPYAMLRPVVRRQFYMPPAAGTFTASLADTTATTDALTAQAAGAATLADTAATADAFTNAGVYTASLSDSVATSDTLSGLGAAAGSFTTTATASDAVSGTGAATASLSDTVAASDSRTGTGAATASLSDTAATSDALSGQGAATATLSDTAATSDAFTNTGSGAYTAGLTDSAATADNLTGLSAVSALLSDTATSSDNLTGLSASAANLSDTVAASDSLTGTRAAAATLSDTAASSDALAGQGGAAAALADSAATSDSVTNVGSGAYTAGLSDSTGTSDTLTPLAAFLGTLTDSPITSDSVSAVLAGSASWSDGAAASDAFTVSASGVYSATLADTAATADTLLATLGIAVIALADHITSADSVSLVLPVADAGQSWLIDALDAALAQSGETIRLLRLGAAPAEVTCRALIRGYQPSDLVPGSGITQQDQTLIMSPTEINAAGWPGIGLPRVPRQGDRVLSNRGALTVQAAVGLYVQDVLVRIEAQVRGQ